MTSKKQRNSNQVNEFQEIKQIALPITHHPRKEHYPSELASGCEWLVEGWQDRRGRASSNKLMFCKGNAKSIPGDLGF